jgi:homoserine O-acetyltransferase
MGGQQLLEWAVRDPDLFELIIPVATNARHSPWGIAFNTAQRMALESDKTFYGYTSDAGKTGLKTARAIGMLSYRNMDTFNQTQRDDIKKTSSFAAESYQRYQGEKLARRFDAHSYYTLSKAMDSHHIGRNYDSLEDALKQIKSNVLAIGIKSDLLFPPQEQEFIARHSQKGKFTTLESLYGHDGFLIEVEKLTRIISPVLNS